MARYVHHTARKTNLKEVYVWELPVRFYHWINVVSIVALCITGYLIGNPIGAPNTAEASYSFMFGTIRFIHFISAFIFFFNFVARLYWGFVGNTYSRWYNFIPFKKEQWQQILCVLKVDIFQIVHKKIKDIGHNSLAATTYFFTFIAFVLQSLTGFGMYAAMSDSWFPKLFAWIVPVLGGDLPARNLHHILMWVFILFAMIHIYLVFYHDYIERRGITSSMIGGWKFIEEGVLNEIEAEENK